MSARLVPILGGNARNVIALCALSIITLSGGVAHAQTSDYRFEHISIDQGLSKNSVFCIFQDSQGFMWFGTEDGLNRYDGYKIIVFKHDPQNPASMVRRKC